MNKNLKLAILGGVCFLAGELTQIATGYKIKDAPKTTLDSILINKDTVSDMVIRDEVNNNYFVMLSTSGGQYEKCDISMSSIIGTNWIYSEQDKGYYGVESGNFFPSIKLNKVYTIKNPIPDWAKK